MPRDYLRSDSERRFAAGLFLVLILAAVLLFGAVDRVVQLGLVFGLGIGFLIHPPDVPPLRRSWVWVLLAAFIVAVQFLPFSWFGGTVWHSTLSRDYGAVFPFTHNPEPGRAVDCLLAGFLMVAWFFWVRTLASDRPVRLFLVWALFGAAACVGLVSLILGTRTDYFIYGMRYTPGWTGFGPFPNRNHTAALLAMGALGGAGILVRSVRRRHWAELAVSVLLEVVLLMALIDSKSRGGLLGLGCGVALFAVLGISKLRTRVSVAGALAGVLLCAALVLSFGSKVLSRFESTGDGNIPNNLRWQIWQNALGVWRDAPLWGHGLGTFAQVFPLYQTVQAHEQVILHPESSWLLWLVELGAIPVAIGVVCLIWFIARNAIGAIQSGDRGFFTRAGAFAGVFGLLCHGLWDVPIHRWGTVAFGIALLAIACPPLHRRQEVAVHRGWALAPIFISVFWLLPFIGLSPASSPEGAHQLLARLAYSPTAAPLSGLIRVEAWFPLNPQLREQIGIRELIIARRPERAWAEFRIADRLSPASWAMPAMQGWLAQDFSPGMAFHFWSMAIERAGRRAPDLFTAAYRNCANLRGGDEFWRNYAQAHPEFELCYAEAAPNDQLSRSAFEDWWKNRGDTNTGIDAWEPPAFYAALRRWGDRAKLEIWMNRRPELEATEFKTWASILHDWQLDADAWKVLSRRIKEPDYPISNDAESAQALEGTWRAHPDDPSAALAYARECSVTGNPSKSEQVILSVAAGKSPPSWFIEKAAFLYAARKDYATAVTSLLRLKSTDNM